MEKSLFAVAGALPPSQAASIRQDSNNSRRIVAGCQHQAGQQ
ncbi:hypothetical protein [Enterobacter hormaechei]|nr:hypothetical protein [Enterobacter hormaechei]